MHARITGYKGKIVCELLATASIDNEVATSIDNPDVFGQVIINTEKHLGVSAEAIGLMKIVKIGGDSIGDIDWFGSIHGDSFGWIGGPWQIVDAAKATAARDFKILKYIEIPNDVPEGAKQHIDSKDPSGN